MLLARFAKRFRISNCFDILTSLNCKYKVLYSNIIISSRKYYANWVLNEKYNVQVEYQYNKYDEIDHCSIKEFKIMQHTLFQYWKLIKKVYLLVKWYYIYWITKFSIYLFYVSERYVSPKFFIVKKVFIAKLFPFYFCKVFNRDKILFVEYNEDSLLITINYFQKWSVYSYRISGLISCN